MVTGRDSGLGYFRLLEIYPKVSSLDIEIRNDRNRSGTFLIGIGQVFHSKIRNSCSPQNFHFVQSYFFHENLEILSRIFFRFDVPR